MDESNEQPWQVDLEREGALKEGNRAKRKDKNKDKEG